MMKIEDAYSGMDSQVSGRIETGWKLEAFVLTDTFSSLSNADHTSHTE